MTRMEKIISHLKKARIERVLAELADKNTSFAAHQEMAEIRIRQSQGYDLGY